MLIEVHMLKNYPPTNLNRDESGAPKTAVFAGVPRGRISSQCLKRSWRKSAVFCDAVGEDNIAVRTRRMPEYVCDTLVNEKGVPEEWRNEIEKMLARTVTGKESAKDSKTQVAIFSKADIKAVTDAVKPLLDRCETVEDVKKALKPAGKKKSKGMPEDSTVLGKLQSSAESRSITADIAAFGRMVTSEAFRNVEAAIQVAHALSTNRLSLEQDFFTAVDDLIDSGIMKDAGAAMMDDTGFDSCCYYVYVSIDVDTLQENLRMKEKPDVLTRNTVAGLLEAMAYTNPSGMQNRFAGNVLPSAIMVQCKERKIPVSLVNAFARPVRSDEKRDLVTNSIRQLVAESENVDKRFGIPVASCLWFAANGESVPAPKNAVVCETYTQLIDAVRKVLGA